MSYEVNSSRHLALLRRAGDVMTVCGTLFAALFIAMMTGLTGASIESARIEAPAHGATGESVGQAAPRAPVRMAQAVFVR